MVNQNANKMKYMCANPVTNCCGTTIGFTSGANGYGGCRRSFFPVKNNRVDPRFQNIPRCPNRYQYPYYPNYTFNYSYNGYY